MCGGNVHGSHQEALRLTQSEYREGIEFMQSGFASLQKAIEESKNNGDFSGGSLSYFSWKDKDRKFVRFLTDAVITADFHEFIITNDGKTKSFLIDPDKGDFVAKYASPVPGLGWRQDFKTKQAAERKPSKKTVGVAVLRDRVPVEGGGFEMVDVLIDADDNGTAVRGRSFGLITQSHGNFWKSLIGYFELYGTICDRDYMIVREGSGTDTSYTITPVDPIPELKDIAVVQEFYGYGRPWNKDDPERFLFCPQTLEEWADYYSGEERAKHWLEPKDGTAVAPQGPAPSLSAPVVSTATGAPVVHQQQVPAPAPAFTPAFVPTGADEAQAGPAPAVAVGGNTEFAGLRARLLDKK
ncbi:hypothetical protein SEA_PHRAPPUCCINO_118 [Mycobacterium phage Phrappuccino]|uniref:SsDNA binding protein n=1 Tax=Mycobacterium phage Phrappuccino TaxID=2591223 RepID=A0A514DDV2_9CAUD|nr:single strand DNA binding protein [Mycobacterium phage Phrappuccino]QDH91793.1 hypothetical protein SEA_PHRAPPUCCINO_118 [Mycobacterium phage Phrappuccino]QIQ63235.1 hypothetical protein SEA_SETTECANDELA_118 [Mycobacterium phage Settecandela]